MKQANLYCDVLGIEVPSLDRVARHPAANTFARLLLALLEQGAPMTLAAAAERFEQAGLGPADAALRSLSRCRPARPPVYRDGDLYALDPHDDELDLWAFRLGLRPPRHQRPLPPPPEPEPRPAPEVPLAVRELEEAFRGGDISSWSAQRLALAVLDAHGGCLSGPEVVAKVNGWTPHHSLRVESAAYWRAGAIEVRADGSWCLVPAHRALRAARLAVRDRVALERRHRAARYLDEDAFRTHLERVEAERAAHGADLARLRRVLVVAFPPAKPARVTLLDVAERTLETYTAAQLDGVRARLTGYDVIGGLDVRQLLRALAFDPGQRRLAELGPPQKTIKLNSWGRALQITPGLLVQGCCGIARPFGDPAKLRAYLERGDNTRLRRRLEADARSLYALYEYGRLHHFVRLRWGFLDERLPAPWVHPDEPGLDELMREAHRRGGGLHVVLGTAPGWEDPWARATCCDVHEHPHGYGLILVDPAGWVLDERDVQRARLAEHAESTRAPGRSPASPNRRGLRLLE